MISSIKLSDYFEIKNPTYVYIQIIPHRSIRNYNSNNIAKAIAYTYKAINKRVHREQKKLIIESSFKISYIIDISNNNASFYFLVPKFYKNIIVEKIKEIWQQATIQDVEGLKKFNDPLVYSLSYKKDDALSLNVDKKSNEPLNSILNVMDIMKDDDKVRIIYNFIPCNQLYWKDKYSDMMDKLKNNKPLEKKITSFDYIFKVGLGTLLNILDCVVSVLDDFAGVEKNRDESIYKSVMSIINQQNVISNSTRYKKEATIINGQIAILSHSKDLTRRNNNALSVCQSYHVVDEDNELIYKKVKSKFTIEDYDLKIDKSTFSTDECQNFIQLPASTLLKDFNIEHIDTTEANIPDELQEGTICIGESTCKGVIKKAYLSTDKEYRNLTLCLIGPTRAGKTTLIQNLSNDAIAAGECNIIFDFCGQCELSNDISTVIDKEKVLNIDCSDNSKLQGLGFNELFNNSNDPFEIYKAAKMQTSQLVSFINAININNELEPRMNRYLKASALITFINNGSFKDVFNVLQDCTIRDSFISKIKENQYENLSEYIQALRELDEIGKNGERIGTKISFIQGILNRLDSIKGNAYMELMLKKKCDNNINLVDEIQKNQLICLKMPETMFSTDEEKDIYCTYWLVKIWGALQQRHDKIQVNNRVKVNIIFDELYQVPTCQSFLKSKLNQIAKKTCKAIISCHSLEQVKYIRPELKSANTSYMLISGCNKDNYRELQEELEPFQLEDLLNLERYYSLNLIKTNEGYAQFITKLPKPIKEHINE